MKSLLIYWFIQVFDATVFEFLNENLRWVSEIFVEKFVNLIFERFS